MKKVNSLILILLALFLLPLSAQELPKGEPVKAPTPTPKAQKKYCAHCGIEMRNITYAWQHYEWCPYYQPREGSVSRPKPPSSSQIVSRAATEAVTTAIGQSLASDVSRAMDEYAASAAKTYKNNRPGESAGEEGRYVVGVNELSWSNKVGVFDNRTREWKVKPHYQDIRLVDMRAAIAVKGGKVGLIDCWEDKAVVPFEYDIWRFENHGFFSALGRYTGTERKPSIPEKKRHSKWGVWDYKGKNIIPVEYDSIKFSSIGNGDQLILSLFVYKEGKMGLCDYDGDVVLPTEYEWISGVRKIRNSYCVFASKDHRLYGLFDATGKPLTGFKYSRIVWEPNYGVEAKEGGKREFGLLDGKGQTVIPFEYDTLRFVVAPDSLYRMLGVTYLVVTEKDGRYGAYDVNGKELLKPCHERSTQAVFHALSRIPRYSYHYFLSQQAARIIATKGEFETTEEFEARKTDPEKQTRYLENELKGSDKEFLRRQVNLGQVELVLGPYNADGGHFDIAVKGFSENSYRLVIKREDAKQFKEAFNSMKAATLGTAKFFVANDALAIAEMQFEMPDGRVYFYLNPNTPDNDGSTYLLREL